MKNFFDFPQELVKTSEEACARAEKMFDEIEKTGEYNEQKVLSAFIESRVDETDFNTTTGYGYGDKGRDKADRVAACIFGSEDAIIRAGALACGTHTLGVALYGVLRPGDTMLSVTGLPYDTIHPVIGINGEKGNGSLADFGVTYRQIDLTESDEINYDEIEAQASKPDVRMVYVQRSRGYSLRHSISVDEIEKVCEITHRVNKNAVVMVDNCYGEFVEKKEPTEVGADLMAGSLIKNAGGGIAPSGGYIAGRKDLVELCCYRMTVPGLGREVGATLGQTKSIYQGLFAAPVAVKEALKTAVFASALFENLGFKVTPTCEEKRHDIIQAICLENEDRLVAFCQGMQKGAPVDSHVTPLPWDMPGYDSKVIMSSGAFTSGSSIELSADAPLREPYAVWMQGGLNFYAGKLGVMLAAKEIIERKLL